MCQTELEPILDVKFEVDFYEHSSPAFHKIVLLSQFGSLMTVSRPIDT